MDKVTVELTEDEAILFREFQKAYYWFKQLNEAINKDKVKDGYVTYHFTRYEEVGSMDLLERVEKKQHIKTKLPV